MIKKQVLISLIGIFVGLLQACQPIAFIQNFAKGFEKGSKNSPLTNSKTYEKNETAWEHYRTRALYANTEAVVQVLTDSSAVDSIEQLMNKILTSTQSSNLMYRYIYGDSTSLLQLIDSLHNGSLLTQQQYLKTIPDLYHKYGVKRQLDARLQQIIVEKFEAPNTKVSAYAIAAASVCNIAQSMEKGYDLLQSEVISDKRILLFLSANKQQQQLEHFFYAKMLFDEGEFENVQILLNFAHLQEDTVIHILQNLAHDYLYDKGFQDKYSKKYFGFMLKHPSTQSLGILANAIEQDFYPFEGLQEVVTLLQHDALPIVLTHLQLQDNDTKPFHVYTQLVQHVGNTLSLNESVKRNITQLLVQRFNAVKYPTLAYAYQLVKALKSIQTSAYLDVAHTYFTDSLALKSVQKSYGIYQKSALDIGNDMYTMGLISERLPNTILAQADTANYKSHEGKTSTLMEKAHIFSRFQAGIEADYIPDYESLLTYLCSNSRNVLNEAQICMDTLYNNVYNVYVLHNKTAFVIQAPNIGAWYDVQLIKTLLNEMLKHAQVPERYVFLPTQTERVTFIYGPTESAMQFADKYGLYQPKIKRHY